MRSLYSDPLSPLFRRPDAATPAPEPFIAPHPPGSRRPHTDGKVARVRRLIEDTHMTYAEIAARTGVAPASICRWTRDGGWVRPLFAPRATDTVPTARASAKLRRRMLAGRLSALAERHVRELEASACVDAGQLEHALALLAMAKLAARPRKRRNRGGAAAAPLSDEAARARVIADLRAAGVDVARTPREILDDLLDREAPPRDDPALRPRGRRSRRNREHAWMLERDGS